VSKLISIIVPIYKVEKYLDSCIESLVGQTYKNLEIILVDDGSPDECPKKCDEWAKKDNRIKVIHKANGGLVDAWTTGVRKSLGEYIAFVDGDDFVASDFLMELYESIDKNSADISICDYIQHFVHEEKIVYQQDESAVYAATDTFNCVELFSFQYKMWHSRCNKLFKRELVVDSISHISPNVTMGEDLNMTFVSFAKAKRVAYTNKALYYYRILPKSMSHGEHDHWGSYVNLLIALNNFIEREMPDEKVKKVYNRYAWEFFYETAKVYKQNKKRSKIVEVAKSKLLIDSIWKCESFCLRHTILKSLAKTKLYLLMPMIIKV